MAFFGKVFKYHSSENHDAFLNTLGLPAEALAIFLNFKPDQKIEKSGDTYIYTVSTPKGDKSLSFTSGDEIEDQTRDVTITNIFTVEDNVVTHVLKFDSGLVITAKKEFSANKMVEEVTNNNWDGVARVSFNA